MNSENRTQASPSTLALLIADYVEGRAPRPVLVHSRMNGPNALEVIALRDGETHHATLIRDQDGAITAVKNTPRGTQPLQGLGLDTAARESVKTLTQDVASLTGKHPQNAARLISELCSVKTDPPTRTKLTARAMRAEETFHMKLVDPDLPRLLRSINATLTLSAYNALVHCRTWLPAALASHPEETAHYLRITVNEPGEGRPYPKGPAQIPGAVRRKPPP